MNSTLTNALVSGLTKGSNILSSVKLAALNFKSLPLLGRVRPVNAAAPTVKPPNGGDMGSFISREPFTGSAPRNAEIGRGYNNPQLKGAMAASGGARTWARNTRILRNTGKGALAVGGALLAAHALRKLRSRNEDED